jgi:hypothetical protein
MHVRTFNKGGLHSDNTPKLTDVPGKYLPTQLDSLFFQWKEFLEDA